MLKLHFPCIIKPFFPAIYSSSATLKMQQQDPPRHQLPMYLITH